MEVKWYLISPCYPTHVSIMIVWDLHPRYAWFLSTCFSEGELMIANRCRRKTPAIYAVDPGSQVQKDPEDYVHSE